MCIDNNITLDEDPTENEMDGMFNNVDDDEHLIVRRTANDEF